jgi:hypothetical protein
VGVHGLSSTEGIVALAAGAVAVVALIGCVALAVSLRRLRARQRVVLGERDQRDVIAHGSELEAAFDALRDYVEDAARRLDARLGTAEDALARALAHRSLIRYDAYNEMSGHQSLSIALLDATSSGIVLSSIHHREQARLYAKQVHNGQGELELSPEEAEAVRRAAAGPAPAAEG